MPVCVPSMSRAVGLLFRLARGGLGAKADVPLCFPISFGTDGMDDLADLITRAAGYTMPDLI